MDYKELHRKDGDFYFIKICEELSELQTAILHYKQGKINAEDVIEEVADVIIQLDKVCAYLGDFDRFKTWHIEKKVSEVKDAKQLDLEKYILDLCQECNAEVKDMCICGDSNE